MTLCQADIKLEKASTLINALVHGFMALHYLTLLILGPEEAEHHGGRSLWRKSLCTLWKTLSRGKERVGSQASFQNHTSRSPLPPSRFHLLKSGKIPRHVIYWGSSVQICPVGNTSYSIYNFLPLALKGLWPSQYKVNLSPSALKSQTESCSWDPRQAVSYEPLEKKKESISFQRQWHRVSIPTPQERDSRTARKDGTKASQKGRKANAKSSCKPCSQARRLGMWSQIGIGCSYNTALLCSSHGLSLADFNHVFLGRHSTLLMSPVFWGLRSTSFSC